MTMMHTRRSSAPSGASGRAEFAQAVDLDNFRRLRRRGATITRSFRLRPADGEDVVQEALIRMMRASESADETPKRFDAYFDSTVRHLCIDFLRTNGRETELPEPEQLPVASKAERQDQRILVHQVLSEMPASSRSILVKSHIEGRSLSEIASELGISSNACSAMLYRARRTFRDRYVRSHVLPTDDEQCAAIRALMVDSTLAVGSEYEMVVADHRRECDDCESQYAFLLSARSAAASALLPGGLAAATAGGFLGFLGLGSMRSSGSGSSGVAIGAVAAVAVVAVGATAFAINSARQISPSVANPTPSNSAGAGNSAPPVATLPAPIPAPANSSDTSSAAITMDPADIPAYYPPIVPAVQTPVVRAPATTAPTPSPSVPAVVPSPEASTPAPEASDPVPDPTTPAPAPEVTTPAPAPSTPAPAPSTPAPSASPSASPSPSPQPTKPPVKVPVDVDVPSALSASESIYVEVNSSTEPLSNIRVRFEAPDDATFEAASALFSISSHDPETSGVECVTTPDIVTCTLSELAAGAEPVRFDAGYLQNTEDDEVLVTISADGREDVEKKIIVSAPALKGTLSRGPDTIDGTGTIEITVTAGSEPISLL